MFRKVSQMFFTSSSLRLSEFAHEISIIPGTEKRRVLATTERKYRELTDKAQSFFRKDLCVTEITRRQLANFSRWLEIKERGNDDWVDLEELENSLQSSTPHQTINATSTNSYYRRWRGMWNQLTRQGYDVVSIDGLFADLPEPIADGKAPSADTMTKLFMRAPIRNLFAYLYMRDAGFRRQTLSRLTLRNTRFWSTTDGELRITSLIPSEKGGRPRPIAGFQEPALAGLLWLLIRPVDSLYLFNKEDSADPVALDSWNSIQRKDRKRANIPDSERIYFHGFRHGSVQRQLEEGRDPALVAQSHGMSTETMNKVYATRKNSQLLRSLYGDDIDEYAAAELPSGIYLPNTDIHGVLASITRSLRGK